MFFKTFSFPFFKQLDAMDCGPACLKMIAKYYGVNFSLHDLRERCFITRDGVSFLGICTAAESLGMRSMCVKISYEQLEKDALLPCIVHWNRRHFVVVYKIDKKFVHVADPSFGLIKYSIKDFLQHWESIKKDEQSLGFCLLLEPTPNFYDNKSDEKSRYSIISLFSYIKPYRRHFIILFIGLILGSLLQFIFPFLTQVIVDKGISSKNINFIVIILIAQLFLSFSRTSINFVRDWLLLHISTRVSISLISNFLIKLMKLPLQYFDSKKVGDIIQRIDDHKRIQSFLTSSSLSVLFSLINIIVFGIILAIYDLTVLIVFVAGSVLYILWIYFFMRKRRELDYKRFSQLSINQSNVIQLINGMQEIKLNNCEKQKRWEWEETQIKLFKVNMKGLSLSQFQQIGALFINETKNIIITFISAYSVINGNISIGMMLAIQYIIGQLNSPIEQLIGLMQTSQDATISMERLGEIHNLKDEEEYNPNSLNIIPATNCITIQNVSFQYEGPESELVLEDVSFTIPEKKVTAIVGVSGSGKTTLLKLLLGFYKPTKGEIKIGNTPLNNINNSIWRHNCGAVLQDGFIFSDTIANNITISDEYPEVNKLLKSIRIANISDFIESLPFGLDTKIGSDGHGLSQGQKQRLLIARAIYKNPLYLFFDEATNSLDANNELIIMNNLKEYFNNRTVVFVAHRLSTVKNADQIVVLEKGKIIELGTHSELTKSKGIYFNLVKNQLELGN